MKKLIALTGLAAALMFAMPMTAEAGHYGHSRHHNAHGAYHGHGHFGHHAYRHMQRRSFTHWRPGLERHHYRGFGRPAFHDHYYRVRAHDRHGRLVFLNVNAYTGLILSVGY